MTENTVTHSNDSTMSAPEPGLRRQVMSTSDTMMLVRHRMEAGWVGQRHSHPHEQLVYVVSGAIRLNMQGESYDLRAGDSLLVPGGVEHEASASEASEVLDVFTPAREDYR
jgi:quercetin dioxygenase-like cupin family protein